MMRYETKCCTVGCQFEVADSAKTVVDAAWDAHKNHTRHQLSATVIAEPGATSGTIVIEGEWPNPPKMDTT